VLRRRVWSTDTLLRTKIRAIGSRNRDYDWFDGRHRQCTAPNDVRRRELT